MFADFRNRQDRTDLVVGVHDGDQGSVLPNRLRHLMGSDGSQRAHGEQLHLKALVLQPFQGVQDGVVLKGGGDDMPFPPPGPQ